MKSTTVTNHSIVIICHSLFEVMITETKMYKETGWKALPQMGHCQRKIGAFLSPEMSMPLLAPTREQFRFYFKTLFVIFSFIFIGSVSIIV